jgi:hypothetical protein
MIARVRGNLSFWEKKLTTGLNIYAKIPARIKGVKIARSTNKNTNAITASTRKNIVLGFMLVL